MCKGELEAKEAVTLRRGKGGEAMKRLPRWITSHNWRDYLDRKGDDKKVKALRIAWNVMAKCSTEHPADRIRLAMSRIQKLGEK